ncbi:hypothetical protein KCU94_g11768, partial [Aureobasidium melanogenum]
YITSIVTMLGLDANPPAHGISWSGIEVDSDVAPFVYPLAKIRDEVRKQAIAGTIDAPAILSHFDAAALKTPPSTKEGAAAAEATVGWLSKLNDLIKSDAVPKAYMPLCDELRDTTLWNLGIYLEDRVNAPALVRPLNASLREERANREALAAMKLEKAKAAKEAKEKEERERLEKGKFSHLEMFRTAEFSEWDEEGLPTKDKEVVQQYVQRSHPLSNVINTMEFLAQKVWISGEEIPLALAFEQSCGAVDVGKQGLNAPVWARFNRTPYKHNDQVNEKLPKGHSS